MTRFRSLLTALVPVIAMTGCEKLPEAPQSGAPGVPPTATPMTDAIPLEYGDLVGASIADASGWALLFFQRPDKSIVAVYVNAQHGIIRDQVVDIPRR